MKKKKIIEYFWDLGFEKKRINITIIWGALLIISSGLFIYSHFIAPSTPKNFWFNAFFPLILISVIFLLFFLDITDFFSAFEKKEFHDYKAEKLKLSAALDDYFAVSGILTDSDLIALDYKDVVKLIIDFFKKNDLNYHLSHKDATGLIKKVKRDLSEGMSYWEIFEKEISPLMYENRVYFEAVLIESHGIAIEIGRTWEDKNYITIHSKDLNHTELFLHSFHLQKMRGIKKRLTHGYKRHTRSRL